MKRTTIRLPEDLLRRAKVKASSEGRSFTSLVEEGLYLVLSPPARSSRQKVSLPVSKAKGGLQSGVDLTHNKSILDVMEE
jgi:hypothetical protein